MTTGSRIAEIVRMTRVLLVEDSPDVLCVLQMELELFGYTVDALGDASMALFTARRYHPDVIVSDLGMPGMDGFEFIKCIREIPSLSTIPAIALTGATFEHDVRQALAFGFTTHMTKPVDGADLDKRIRQLTAACAQLKAS